MIKKDATVYWLLPREPARAFFLGQIRELAARFDAPFFEPHVTLFVDDDGSHDAAEVVGNVSAIQLRLGVLEIRSCEQFTKTLPI